MNYNQTGGIKLRDNQTCGFHYYSVILHQPVTGYQILGRRVLYKSHKRVALETMGYSMAFVIN